MGPSQNSDAVVSEEMRETSTPPHTSKSPHQATSEPARHAQPYTASGDVRDKVGSYLVESGSQAHTAAASGWPESAEAVDESERNLGWRADESATDNSITYNRIPHLPKPQ